MAVCGPVRLDEDHIAAIRSTLDNGSSTDGLPLRSHAVEPDDRLRLWLPERFTGKQLWITPSELPGIEQPPGTLPAIVGHDLADQVRTESQ